MSDENEFPIPDADIKDTAQASRHIWKISEIIHEIGYRLETDFGLVWLEGEVSGLRRPSSGHIYFSLKDESSQIKAVLFRNQASRLSFELEDGALVVCLGRLNIYPGRGDLQLIVEAFEHKGEGALRIAFESLKERLLREGLFDPEHKSPLPFLPSRVFVVTSPTGAAIRDFIKASKNRFSNAHIIISPSRVQGEGACLEIIQALKKIKAAARQGDVALLTRGGGSLEDLWAFNDEALAREIYDFPIPVVSAVGHEIDFTISDFVADMRAATPTAASQAIFPDSKELSQKVESLKKHIILSTRHRLAVYGKILHAMRHRLRDPKNIIVLARLRHDELTTKAHQFMRQKVHGLNARFIKARNRLSLQSPRKNVEIKKTGLSALTSRLESSCKDSVGEKKYRLKLLSAKLNAISPLNVLSRGYSLAYKLPEKKLIRDSKDVSVSDRLFIKPHSGSIVCKVIAKEDED